MGFHEMPFTLLTLLAVLLAAADAVAASDLAKPGCQSTCGNLTIPFPFGTKKGCYLEDKTNSYDNFYVKCSDSQLYLGESNVRVADISLDGEVKILSFIARACFNEFGNLSYAKLDIFLRHPKFTISYTRNKFIAVGCSTMVLIRSYSTLEHRYFTGCFSTCTNIDDARNGSCSGTACCQSPIQEGVRGFNATIANPFTGDNPILKTLPCSYAFLVEENAYNFSSLDLKDLQGRERFPVVLDWAVGNETCEEAKKNQSYACTASNSYCIPSSNGPGYRCNCSSGYEGNPYLADGCKDINECLLTTNPCEAKATCKNVIGNVSCACPDGYEGDGEREGSGCTKKSQALTIALGISMSFLGLVVASSLVYCLLAKRKLMKQREKFFQQNGGFMLREQLSKHERSIETTKIFTAEDLKKATNNYDKSRIIGQGGYGTVFKGNYHPMAKRLPLRSPKYVTKARLCNSSTR